MNTIVRPALVLFASLTVICGVLYPLATTGIGKVVFPQETAGSIVEHAGKPVGSTLIGQSFTSPKYFWGRPSATAPMANNGAGSGGSNLGPSNPALVDAVKTRIAALKEADPGNTRAIPVDLVTASGSGLDPEISLAAAIYQAPRVARVRGLPLAQVENAIAKAQKTAYVGFFGEARVNVLELNLALDAAAR
ncbi:potassium-transporting ATPase subunit KdpC [Janthinobacterium psychrotolerans]|uniref:Potassium-transporting ATPase KdpC subunit n=1 Tax=Janthinobacterium psychrotolerans TaxID=1747903 RepID=A0A1A7BXH4_9BURK|nr:potassium-transporting ATPase subunit KdpC [Janthinobacterium psychrotolerans]OBV37444.1 K+-transporting ATPase ATPase C chain [Janthinobacterium psychrotolerans]